MRGCRRHRLRSRLAVGDVSPAGYVLNVPVVRVPDGQAGRSDENGKVSDQRRVFVDAERRQVFGDDTDRGDMFGSGHEPELSILIDPPCISDEERQLVVGVGYGFVSERDGGRNVGDPNEWVVDVSDRDAVTGEMFRMYREDSDRGGLRWNASATRCRSQIRCQSTRFDMVAASRISEHWNDELGVFDDTGEH